MKGRESVAFFLLTASNWQKISMSTQMLKVTTETEINDVRRQVGRIFHVNATVFKNPLNCIGYISFTEETEIFAQ